MIIRLIGWRDTWQLYCAGGVRLSRLSRLGCWVFGGEGPRDMFLFSIFNSYFYVRRGLWCARTVPPLPVFQAHAAMMVDAVHGSPMWWRWDTCVVSSVLNFIGNMY